MARKLTDIATYIHQSEERFSLYLHEYLPKECMAFIDQLAQDHAVYFFSGIIRDFFLRRKEKNRDIDIMIDGEENSVERILQNYTFRQNSFGGYKVRVGAGDVDLWHIKNTWALTHGQTVIDFELHTYIPQTAFFNFSSIIYDYKAKKFHFTVHFQRFLRDRHIDVVYLPNPNQALCVVNTIYYSKKYNLKISPRLWRFIRKIYPLHIGQYETVQQKHFGVVLYDEENLKNEICRLPAP